MWIHIPKLDSCNQISLAVKVRYGYKQGFHTTMLRDGAEQLEGAVVAGSVHNPRQPPGFLSDFQVLNLHSGTMSLSFHFNHGKNTRTKDRYRIKSNLKEMASPLARSGSSKIFTKPDSNIILDGDVFPETPVNETLCDILEGFGEGPGGQLEDA